MPLSEYTIKYTKYVCDTCGIVREFSDFPADLEPNTRIKFYTYTPRSGGPERVTCATCNYRGVIRWWEGRRYRRTFSEGKFMTLTSGNIINANTPEVELIWTVTYEGMDKVTEDIPHLDIMGMTRSKLGTWARIMEVNNA